MFERILWQLSASALDRRDSLMMQRRDGAVIGTVMWGGEIEPMM